MKMLSLMYLGPGSYLVYNWSLDQNSRVRTQTPDQEVFTLAGGLLSLNARKVNLNGFDKILFSVLCFN